jgi:hypothetical protein
MRGSFRVFAAAAMAALIVGAAAAETAINPKVDELIRLHDLRTSVSIGNYYLKQESLLSVRSLLARIGRDEDLGADWQPRNPYWRQAEESLLEQLMGRVDRDFSSLEWLRPLWTDLGSREFSERELDLLIAHFQSDVGRKQVRIVDHTVSTHVMMALSFSGKLKDIPGAEEERIQMQTLWNEEDGQMRFSIQDSANADGQAFALSPLGKKYFVTAILKLTGIVSRHIDDMAARLPQETERYVDAVRPFVQEFKRARS